MASEYETVYAKYKVIDKKTGAEKHGKYFVLKIDTADQEEREAVFAALSTYAKCQAAFGYIGYAEAVMRYIESKREVTELRECLKVAEDALEKITTGCFSHKDGDKPIVQVIIDIASNALFEIHEEGGDE